MSATSVRVHLVPGPAAPKYETGKELVCEDVVITEQGTVARLPIVDFRCHDAEGNLLVLTLTGRIVQTIASAVRGVNLRNHGKEEP